MSKDTMELRELLADLREFLDDQADADHVGECYVPNRAMALMIRVETQLRHSPVPTPVLFAIERLRESQGPGGIHRADVMLLCDYVDPK
jgi:hypothetical protein